MPNPETRLDPEGRTIIEPEYKKWKQEQVK